MFSQAEFRQSCGKTADLPNPGYGLQRDLIVIFQIGSLFQFFRFLVRTLLCIRRLTMMFLRVLGVATGWVGGTRGRAEACGRWLNGAVTWHHARRFTFVPFARTATG